MKKLFTALMVLGAVLTLSAEELAIRGNFPNPRKPGLPPAGWNKMSSSKGTFEVISTESGNAVMLNAEPGANCGIYSPAVAAKAGDKIKITVNARGENIGLGIFQYSNPRGTTAQRKLTAIVDGKAEAEFVVANTRKGTTNNIRICIYAANGQGASVLNVKAFRAD